MRKQKLSSSLLSSSLTLATKTLSTSVTARSQAKGLFTSRAQIGRYMSSDSNQSRYQRVLQRLTQEFQPSSLLIKDESHLHAGHAAMKGLDAKETHFRVEIISEAFKGKTLIQRHRMVNEILKDELDSGLHALSLKTKTNEEMEKTNKQ